MIVKQEGVYFQYWIIFTFHNKLDCCYIDLILLDYWLQNIKYVYIIDNKFISMGICKKEWRSSITIFKRIRLWTSMNLSFKINPIVLPISFFLWRIRDWNDCTPYHCNFLIASTFSLVIFILPIITPAIVLLLDQLF